MDVFLMRHPAREAEQGLCIGQSDVELSADGISSFPDLVEKAAVVKPTRVASSDLVRCQKLANEIARHENLAVEVSSAWREINFGRWENCLWDEIRHHDAKNFAAWTEDFVTVAPPK